MSMIRCDPATFLTQDRFGKSDNPAGQRGNCLQTCLASLLNLPLAEVPHFYDTDETAEDQYVNSSKWLAERGWIKLWVPWDWLVSNWIAVPSQGLVIVGGKSPRGDWSHVVIGQIHGTEWSLVHDPHPSQTGLDGTPYGFHLLAPLPTLK
jgi:hypothetical protein